MSRRPRPPVWVPVTERDNDDPLRSEGPIVMESYTGRGLAYQVLDRLTKFGPRYGERWFGMLAYIVPLDAVVLDGRDLDGDPSREELLRWAYDHQDEAFLALRDAYIAERAGGVHV